MPPLAGLAGLVVYMEKRWLRKLSDLNENSDLAERLLNLG